MIPTSVFGPIAAPCPRGYMRPMLDRRANAPALPGVAPEVGLTRRYPEGEAFAEEPSADGATNGDDAAVGGDRSVAEERSSIPPGEERVRTIRGDLAWVVVGRCRLRLGSGEPVGEGQAYVEWERPQVGGYPRLGGMRRLQGRSGRFLRGG